MTIKRQLIHIALASTFFVSGSSHAVPCTSSPNSCISTVVNATQTTTASPWVIEISPSGQITTVNTNAINVNQPNATILIDPNNLNLNGNAILTTGAGNGINITSTNPIINIGTNSRVSSTGGGIPIIATGAGGGSINNSGTISHNGGAAINLSAATGLIPLFQNGGLIQGDVLLSQGGGNVLTVNGGNIAGNITNYANAQNIISLNGGTVSGTLNLGNFNDVVNIQGGSIQTITGGVATNTYNFLSGSFTTINGTANDVFNILGNLTYSAPMAINNVETYHVQRIGTVFTVNQPLAGIDKVLTLDPSTTMIVNSAVSGTGTLTNAGLLTVGSGTLTLQNATNTGTLFLTPKQQGAGGVLVNPNVTFTNNYTQGPGGVLAIEFSGPMFFGAMEVGAGGATLDQGSMIVPQILAFGSEFLTTGTTFDLITATGGGTITDNSTLIPYSAVLSFNKALINADTILQLTFNRQRYFNVAQNMNAKNVGTILDNQVSLVSQNVPINPDLRFLITQLDNLPTASDLTLALDELTPDVTNGTIRAGQLGMDMVFNTLVKRINEVNRIKSLGILRNYYYGPRIEGVTYGDGNLCPHGLWIDGMAEWINQQEYQNMPGYRVNAEALVLGYDRTFINNTTLGGAASFTKVRAVGKTTGNNVENVKSWQGTLYGFFQPFDSMYVDLLAAAATSEFQINRYINFGDIDMIPSADFDGWQVGGQVDVGYVDLEACYYVIPIARVRFTHLALDDYTEANAGGIGLNVTNKPINELVGGIGFRLTRKFQYEDILYLPEISMMIMRDFTNHGQATSSSFIGGGVAFPTDGVDPPATIGLLDLSVDAYTLNSNVFSIKYEFEVRESYYANSGYIKVYHQWL